MTSDQPERSNIWKVMISSRMRDFDAERQAAEHAIIRANMRPMMAENPINSTLSPETLCRQMATECDLFLLILGPSYGFQPNGQPAGEELSATHMEYNWAKATGKRKVMVFVQRGAETSADERQRQFITEVLDFGRGRICHFFSNAHDLSRAVDEALTSWAATNSLAIHRYLVALRSKYEHVVNPLTGTDIKTMSTILLRLRQDLTAWSPGSSPDTPESPLGESVDFFIPRLRTFTILGTPGSGKSTLLRRQMYELACASLDAPEVPQVPLYVTAVELARNLHTAENPNLPVALQNAVRDSVPVVAELNMDTIWQGQAVVIVDGLDEVGDADAKAAILTALKDQVGDNKAILASRPASYVPMTLPTWRITEVLPLLDEDRDRLVHSVLGQLPRFRGGTNPDSSVEDLLRQLNARVTLRAWAGNPLLLTLVTTVYGTSGGIPDVWARVYRLAVEVLIDSPYRQGIRNTRLLERDRLESFLETIAINMTEHGQISATKEELLQFLASEQLLATHAKPSERLDELLDRAAILHATGPDRWAFVHLTFQEYFTAVALAHLSPPTLLATLGRHRFSARWERPIQLLVSELERVAKATEAGSIVRSIASLDAENVAVLRQPDPLHLSIARAARCQGVRVQGNLEPGPTLARRWFDIWTQSHKSNDYLRLAALEALESLRGSAGAILPQLEIFLRSTNATTRLCALQLVNALIPISASLLGAVDSLSHDSNDNVRLLAGELAIQLKALTPSERTVSVVDSVDGELVASDVPTATSPKGVPTPLENLTDALSPSDRVARTTLALRIGLATLSTLVVGGLPLIAIKVAQRFSVALPHINLPLVGQIIEYILCLAALFWFVFSSLKRVDPAQTNDDTKSRSAATLVSLGAKALPAIPALLRVLHDPTQARLHLTMARTLASLLAGVDDISGLGQATASLSDIVEVPEEIFTPPAQLRRIPTFQPSSSNVRILGGALLQAITIAVISSLWPQISQILRGLVRWPSSVGLNWPPTWPPTGAWTLVYCLIGVSLLLSLLLLLLLFGRNRRKEEPVTIEEREMVAVNGPGNGRAGAPTVQREIYAVDPRTGRQTRIAEEITSYEEVPPDEEPPSRRG